MFYVVYTYVCIYTHVPLYVCVYIYIGYRYTKHITNCYSVSIIQHTVISMKAVCMWIILLLSRFAINVVKNNMCIRRVITVFSLRILEY